MWLKRTNAAWEHWLGADDWNVFITLNFGRLNLLEGNKDDAAGKIWRSYLITVDRALYGQTRQQQPRFNRVTFTHSGSNRDFPHVHMLAKSPIAINDFCVALNALWSSKFEAASTPISNSIAPLITATGAAGYALHEEFKNDTGSFCDRLTYINTGSPHLVRTDALARLQGQATRMNLIKARLALPHHIRTTQANYERRENARAAALLRP
jgi:hypothetical protein